MKPIKELPAFNRPREKLKERGAGALSDEELVAAIIGAGTAGRSVRAIARQVVKILRKHKMNLTLEQLMEVPGLGLAKSSQILSAFELARRYWLKPTVQISGPADVAAQMSDIVRLPQEHFVCFSLNGAHELIARRIVTIGLLDQSPIHPREVFADVIADRAAAVIFAHNHPSGDLRPSEADITAHRQLTEAADILGIRILDHVIVSRKGYTSFQQAGLLPRQREE